MRERLARACVSVVLVFGACGGSEDPAPAPAETETPPPVTTVPPGESAPTASPAISSVTVDPGDGTVMIGTGPALYRLAPGAKEAEKLVGQLPGGTVSGNLFVRFAGKDDLLASGHPQSGGLPENLGLIRSRDHGETWEPVDGPEADYHELELAGRTIVGVNAESPDIQVSTDGGKTFEPRTPPAAPIDVVVNPGDPQQWAVSTEQGTFISANGGRSWRPRDTAFGARLVWPAADALYSVERNGRVRVSRDGGRSWDERGDIGGIPSEVSAGRGSELVAAVVGGKIMRSRDGGRRWSLLTTLR